ncbi:MAG TPA: aldolase/citrate lyase family protein [Conexibacter sp.]|jgi:2-keto-3-deoxy-L-rhamnonate aldolase RhmA
MSPLREAMHRGPVLGTFLKLPRPEVVDLLALAGFDFVVCDLEHAQMSEGDARTVLLAARAHDLPVVIRVEELARGTINRLLEQGAAGIQLPRTRSAEDVRALVDLTRFPPVGSRSVGTAHLAAGYGRQPLADYVDDEARRPLLVGQFETRGDAAAVAGLDVAFLGTVDLTVDHGVPGRLDDPAVGARIAQIETAARADGVALGAFAASVDQARAFAAAGYRYIAVSGDVSMLAAGARDAIRETRAALAAARDHDQEDIP